jgi:hypothetical protein
MQLALQFLILMGLIFLYGKAQGAAQLGMLLVSGWCGVPLSCGMGRQSTGRVTPMLMLSGRRIQMIEIALTNLAEKRRCGVCG